MSVPAHLSDEFNTGLDDFDMSDAVIPRLSIEHRDGEFKDGLSNETFKTLNVIILGLVKQRVLWHPGMDDDDAMPMCRSTNHDLGFPNVSEKQPKEKRFPWDGSGFDPKDYPNDGEDVVTPLPCSGCQLKEWGSHPDGKRPFCSEQFTLPVLYDPSGEGDYVPAIITFQKTALKPLKAYLSSFARSRNAAFMAITEMSLDTFSRGQTVYSVPNFKKVGTTEQDDWREYSTNYVTMREFLTAAPGSRSEEESSEAPKPSENKAAPPAAKKKAEPEVVEGDVVDAEIVEEAPEPPKKAAAPKPAPVAEAEDDDELPF